MLFLCLFVGPAPGAELAVTRQAYLQGDYPGCIAQAEKAISNGSEDEEWWLLHLQSNLTLGQYEQARNVLTNALARLPRSIRVRWLGREVWLANGQTNAAAAMVEEIKQLVAGRTSAYRDAPNLVVFGRTALLEGADPRLVLERLYGTAKQLDPTLREVYLASGELALEKHDYAHAARVFQEGLQRLPADPDLHHGLACAYAPSDRALMLRSAQAALEHNRHHVPSLLLLAEHGIDAEDYSGAAQLLDRVQAINPWHPDSWAYRSVLARLQNEVARVAEARQMALRFWPANPRVDHLIGSKLSQKYRFEEGAKHQRQALAYDPTYLPAKAQLAQDCLRLGEELEGWKLAAEVQARDGYDVAAVNLVTLGDAMSRFRTLTNEHFRLRMSPAESAVYGPQALELLTEARQKLAPKYQWHANRPILVEVFSDQKDFAVRTFGMPDNDGFLGVCFGQVITANSPASRPGQRFNWQAMLWHEFVHVITLQLTHNQIPRWLSEGLSVYEERQANRAWGQRMNPQYRERILEGKLTPVAQLSAAFLAPKTPQDLQFAYYQSSLVVEFLVRRFGLDHVLAILKDLGEGISINPALEKHCLPLAKLEQEFLAFARQTAEQLAPGLDWERPLPDRLKLADDDRVWSTWAKARPTNYWAISRQIQQLIEEQKWAEAKPVLERLVSLYPEQTGPESGLVLLAQAHRTLGETNQERQVLARLAEHDGEALDAFRRLLELAAAARDWPAVAQNAKRYLAVDPLASLPLRFLAQAGEALGQLTVAIQARQALLQLDPPNPAEIHFQLAQLLQRQGDPAARRHVLQALEDAPRNRAALRLLLQLNQPTATPTNRAPAEVRP